VKEQTPIYGTSWSWKSYRLGHDWTHEFVKIATDLAKSTVDRCQPGVCGPEEWAKGVTAMAASLVLEMQYVTGDRTRPADLQANIDAIYKAFGVKQ
jgi:hypothetical protein